MSGVRALIFFAAGGLLVSFEQADQHNGWGFGVGQFFKGIDAPFSRNNTKTESYLALLCFICDTNA